MSVDQGQVQPQEAELENEAQEAEPYQDPDDLALAQAQREADEEERSAQVQGGEPSQEGNSEHSQRGDDEHEAKTDGSDKGNEASSQTQMIPYARFKEVNDRSRQAEMELARQRGQFEILKQQYDELQRYAQQSPQQPQGGQTQGEQRQQPTESNPQAEFDQKIAAARQRRKDAAKQWDDGQISMQQLEDIRSEVDDEILSLRERQLEQRTKAELEKSLKPSDAQKTETEYAWSDQQALAQHAQSLEQQYPWTTVLNQGELQWLANVAQQEARDRGQPYRKGAAEDARLQQRVAELSAWFGPQWHPEMVQQPAQGAQQNGGGQQQTNGQQQPQMSEAARQRQRKAQMSNGQQPPNPNNMGTTKDTTTFTESEIAGMSMQDLEDLDPKVLERLR